MECSILDYGARTGDALQTEAIQKAIDDCFLAGGGRVRVPEGIYRLGCIRLRSNVTLYLESGAILEGSEDPEDYTRYLDDLVEPIEQTDSEGISRSVYPFSRWNNAIIRAIDAENIAIIGEKGSLIDGVDCFDEEGEEGYRGPHGINMQNCRNIRLEGYALRNTGNWAHAIFKSNGITARNLKVYAGHDGFDVRTCDNVLIEDCDFMTGDDCVAGFDNCDVVIRRCRFDTACSALRFGGNHVLVEECTAIAPSSYGHRLCLTREQKRLRQRTDETCRHNMLNIFLYYCDHRADPRRTPGDILIRNCRFTNADRLFSLEYDGRHIWCCNRSLAGIRFENCVAEGLKQPIYIYGDADEPLTFELDRVTLSAREGFEQEAILQARNYECINMKEVRLLGFEDPRVELQTEGKVAFELSDPIRIVKGDMLDAGGH